jgi:hypothetical protein
MENLQTWEATTDFIRDRFKRAWRTAPLIPEAYAERGRNAHDLEGVLRRNYEAGFMTPRVAHWAIVQHVRDPVFGPVKHVLDVFRYVERPLADEVFAALCERFPNERFTLDMIKV